MQPVASAGPIFQMLAPSGPFQGNDGADRADRLFQGVGEDLARQGVVDGLAVDGCRLPGIKTQHAQHALFGAAGTADRCAHVQRVQRTQLIEMLLDEIGELEQQVLALVRLDLAPRPLEGPARSRNRGVDVLLIAFGNGGQQFAGGGIAGLKRLAGCGVHPLAIDQHFFVAAVGIGVTIDRNRLSLSHGEPFLFSDF